MVLSIIVAFIIAVVLSIPIVFSMGVASVVAILNNKMMPLSLVVNRIVYGTDSFVLLAIPLFILAGSLMEFGGISSRLVALARSFIGHRKGGLGMTVIVSEMLFSGISGSTTADVSAMTSMLFPSLKRAGYPGEYSVAIVAAASAMGILVPPCIVMVVFGALANVSVAALFLAGFLPAFLLALTIGALIYYQAGKYKLPADKKYSWAERFRALFQSLIPLGMPVIIFGGILGGIFTPTEAAGVAVAYAFIVGVMIYKEINLKDVPKILVDTVITTGIIVFLIGMSSIFSYILALARVPDLVGSFILSISTAKWFFLLACCFLVFFLSIIIEVLPAGLIVIPIFLPHVDALGIERLHFIILVIAAGGLGMFAPPTGVGLIIACSISKTSMLQVTKPLLPFLMVLFVGLFLLILFPAITTIVPKLCGF